MAKIHVLDNGTIDKIAAGEVVERPASVIKELVENAIDAGATAVTVEIKEGGIEFIRVTDNGAGIEKSEVRNAFMRHATSKITQVSDLLKLHSLGFRGEALSSIAAVSKVELITKTKEDMTGIRYCLEGAQEVSYEEIGAPEGTTFIVRNLFFNTPVRRKFLKTAMTEGSYVTDLLEHLALSRPDISIKYVLNGQTKFFTNGDGDLKAIIYRIYGRDIANEMIPFQTVEEDLVLEGFLGKPVLNRANRNFENYFVNSRYIRNKLVSKAIEEGYQSYMMQHRYPFVVLHLTIPAAYLDVNVHPSKMELRFRKSESIYPIISETINDCLIEKPNIIDVKLEQEKEITESYKYVPEPFEIKRNETAKHNEYNFSASFGESVNETDDYTTDSKNHILENGLNDRQIQNTSDYVQRELTETYDDFLTEAAKPKHKIIGQVFETYWIIEYEDKMYIIDQHAAHEKVMFESLMDKLKNKSISTQMINPPIILNLSLKEFDLVNKYLDSFKEIGFDIEPFGGQDFVIRGVPSDLYSLDSQQVLMGIVDSLTNESGKMVPDIITEKIASMSCKAAVKGNSKLSYNEADRLISQLLTLENPYNCPHGRPTIISMSKYELEKKFKRII